jgi:hypothetical protein
MATSSAAQVSLVSLVRGENRVSVSANDLEVIHC